MTEKNVWFITGAGRGMGIDIAQAALAAGHSVVATGRDAVTGRDSHRRARQPARRRARHHRPSRGRSRRQAAVDRFGRIDVLVNNAGNFYAGFFEEISPEQFRAQMETNFFGPLNVTRAVLPVMRAQRSGQVITITSTAGHRRRGVLLGLRGVEVRPRRLDGVAAVEVAPFGIRRWSSSPASSAPSCWSRDHRRSGRSCTIEDYAERTASDHRGLEEHERPAGRRPGETRRGPRHPLRLRRAAAAFHRRRRRHGCHREQARLQHQIDANRELSSSSPRRRLTAHNRRRSLPGR